jgi:class 3 adenylate cyclase
MAVRVADADRDRTVTLLREHVVDGRLTLDEFSERVGRALQARTRGDLEATMTDLPALAAPQEETARRSTRRSHIAVMSGSQTKGRWRIGARTTAVAVMGGCEMDLRYAEIDSPEVVITAVAFWGGVKIIVPEGIDIVVEGFSLMGGRSVKVRDVPMVPGSPRIRIRGFAVMGGIEVRSRSSRSGRELARTVLDNVLGARGARGDLPGGAGSWSPAIDLETLGREIRAQIRTQRQGGRQRHDQRHDRIDSPAGPPPESPSASAPAAAFASAPPAPAPGPTPVPVPPAAEPEPEVPQSGDGTVTILFSDMVNYAGMTEALGDSASRELLREHHRMVRSLLEHHGGREIKVQGDGFMVAFGGVARALRCAAELQQTFYAYSETHSDRPMQIHIGVHTGEAFEEDDDFLGHTVIVASRLASVAGPGEILVSSLSEQLVERSGEFSFEGHREVALKGMTRPQQAANLSWAQ